MGIYDLHSPSPPTSSRSWANVPLLMLILHQLKGPPSLNLQGDHTQPPLEQTWKSHVLCQPCRRMMHPAGVCPKLPFHQGSSSQQACASGNWPDPSMAWVFSAWQDVVTGKEEGDCPTQERTVSLWIVTQFAAHRSTLIGFSFWKRKLRLFPWSPGKTGWQGQSGADFPSQRSKELVPAYVGENTKCSNSKYA